MDAAECQMGKYRCWVIERIDKPSLELSTATESMNKNSIFNAQKADNTIEIWLCSELKLLGQLNVPSVYCAHELRTFSLL